MESLISIGIKVCAVVLIIAAFILYAFPKEKILSVKELAKTFRGTMPPRTVLNDFGKKTHTIFYVSGVLMILFALASVVFG
ncbi:hypothetical protein MNBD_GAMMA17-1578 [hydrothermal vent metagenome]|uniref:Uncharacterized protein n=1 Tax=hydrothermal vent metagenome TaxID=652676 RepID=A0A3B0ZE73_9ZZZZ